MKPIAGHSSQGTFVRRTNPAGFYGLIRTSLADREVFSHLFYNETR
jgi:hypothetical protein